MLIPHHPFVFDVDGSYVDPEVRDFRTDRDNYLRQLQYANRRTLELIDHLLDVPPDRKPVIVLQSDEGPYEGLNNGATATARELEQHFGILNAYHFPHLDQTGLYPTITPVNTFRLLLHDYFGADLPLLPDRNYAFLDPDHLYQFRDVTDDIVS